MSASTILAIDPGNTESGWCLVDARTCHPIQFAKTRNDQLLSTLYSQDFDGPQPDLAVIEMVASYGMAVGAEVFETCVWIGRFYEATQNPCAAPVRLVKRLPVKQHHCHSAKASDANIRQALVDRFAYGQSNHGKGTKKAPGWFHGFADDVWAAYALAVYAADTMAPADEVPGWVPA